jgi:hypothetical protein
MRGDASVIKIALAAPAKAKVGKDSGAKPKDSFDLPDC